MIDVAKYQEQCKGPGKFEGESAACPYFYEQWVNGDGESWFPEIEVTIFTASVEEQEAFNCLAEVGFFVDSQGFVIFKESMSRKGLSGMWSDYFGI